MTDRKTNRTLVATLAAAALLLAAASAANAAHVSRGPSAGVSMAQPGHTSPNFGYGHGYGRGWCYWHPYACYRH